MILILPKNSDRTDGIPLQDALNAVRFSGKSSSACMALRLETLPNVGVEGKDWVWRRQASGFWFKDWLPKRA